jgi:hypothetical protein
MYQRAWFLLLQNARGTRAPAEQTNQMQVLHMRQELMCDRGYQHLMLGFSSTMMQEQPTTSTLAQD